MSELLLSGRRYFAAYTPSVKQQMQQVVRTTMEGLMTKVEYKGYRVWAILQSSGKYRAWFYNFPIGTEVSRVIEGDTEAEAIEKATQFLDGRPELRKLERNDAIAGRWVVNL
jgi:hypothetical protein